METVWLCLFGSFTLGSWRVRATTRTLITQAQPVPTPKLSFAADRHDHCFRKRLIQKAAHPESRETVR